MNAYVAFIAALRDTAPDLNVQFLPYPVGHANTMTAEQMAKAPDDHVKGFNIEIHAWHKNTQCLQTVATFPIHWELARNPTKGIPWCLQQIRQILPPCKTA